eukprot:1138245-Pelagomonas_calceolata.AAC.12
MIDVPEIIELKRHYTVNEEDMLGIGIDKEIPILLLVLAGTIQIKGDLLDEFVFVFKIVRQKYLTLDNGTRIEPIDICECHENMAIGQCQHPRVFAVCHQQPISMWNKNQLIFFTATFRVLNV